MKIIKKIEKQRIGPITYYKLFWLFLMGSLLGIVMEGLWCLVFYGNWETHVTTMWFPLCGIYGLGAVCCYAGCVWMQGRSMWFRFLIFCLVGSGIEFLCGWILEIGLHMTAWDYSGGFLNIRGYVDLPMTILWGVLGSLFYLIMPYAEYGLQSMDRKIWNVICVCFSLYLAVDFVFTAMCMVRWKERHEGKMPETYVGQVLDFHYDDERMAERFCEWSFIR